MAGHLNHVSEGILQNGTLFFECPQSSSQRLFQANRLNLLEKILEDIAPALLLFR